MTGQHFLRALCTCTSSVIEGLKEKNTDYEVHDPAMNASKLTKSPVLEVVERKLHPDKQTTSFQSP